jgi:4'-phosphopantetheinyl transferase
MAVRWDLTQCDGVLADDEVHVWHFSLDLPDDGIASLHGMLDADEKSRAARFKFPAPRNQFIASHAFLRTALARYLHADSSELHFRTSTHGKPELAEGDLQFTLSHTEGAAVVAIARRRAVGVDVERVRENLEPLELADRFFSRQEAEWLRAQPDSQRIPAFFACWTAKEAYIKACGGGLSIPLARFGVMPNSAHAELKLEIYGKPDESERWSMWQLDLGTGLRSALAVEGKNLTVRVGRISELQAIV